MSRFVPVTFLTCVVGLSVCAGARAQTSDDKEKAAHLAAAITACDRGATAPLDPDAKAPPVAFVDLMPAILNDPKLRELVSACAEAKEGAPQEKRLHLQWLRAEFALGRLDAKVLLPQLRALADAGGAEARYLMFTMFERHRARGQIDAPGIPRSEALADLEKAAGAGHQDAMFSLSQQYEHGPLYRRDVRKAVEWAQRYVDAPLQGREPGLHEAERRARARLFAAQLTLEKEGFSATEQAAAFAIVSAETHAGTTGSAGLNHAYLAALRFGRGTQKDAAKARQMLEARAARDSRAVPVLAAMLAAGEGGPADGKRAIALLREKREQFVREAGPLLAGLLLDGRFVGRQPQEAIAALQRLFDIDAKIRLAGLLVDYHPRLQNKQIVTDILTDAATVEEPGALMALVNLKLSDNSQFGDVDGARRLLQPLAARGDRDALTLIAATQYTGLDSSSSQPRRRSGGLSDEQLKKFITEGAAGKQAAAFLLYAKLLRRGVLYPQDDETATKMLINAANLGSVEGMILLGDAYSDGLGIKKNQRERLHAWREAAKHGSLKAKSKIASAFPFDSFDKLMTLREGITERIALYNNGVGRRSGLPFGIAAQMEFSGMLSGGRASDAGAAALAGAVMDAFREAPAGLAENVLTGIGKALPDAVRIEIERALKREGFYRGEANGYFGPDVRKALAAWVDAKGPLRDETPASSAPDTKQQALRDEAAVKVEIVDRVRDWTFRNAQSAKGRKQQLAVIRALGALARYGDPAARWAVVRNYHRAKLVRSVVSPAEVTRYALDILVTRPPGVEKPEFEMIFDLTQIAQDRKSNAVGEAVLAAVRDDPRMQDPLVLGGIMRQFIFAPGACDAVHGAMTRAGLKDIGAEGCEERARTALVAFAKAKGAAGVNAAAREAAAKELVSLENRLAK